MWGECVRGVKAENVTLQAKRPETVSERRISTAGGVFQVNLHDESIVVVASSTEHLPVKRNRRVGSHDMSLCCPSVCALATFICVEASLLCRSVGRESSSKVEAQRKAALGCPRVFPGFVRVGAVLVESRKMPVGPSGSAKRLGEPKCGRPLLASRTRVVIWLILPVVICLSQRLSHACLSISTCTVKLRMAH